MTEPLVPEQPLTGIRVLDLSRILAGPYCTMILGDLGAEIIKVERPGSGDDTRTWGPPFAGGESAYYICCNRNKKSITIDLKKPEGIQLIKDFVKISDVLVENFTPGLMDGFGLGYDTLKKINPRLIYTSISAYGQSGPYRDRPGYDMVLSAVGGLMWITGEQGGKPVKVGVAITDVVTGVQTSGAIMAALLWRERTGKGQYIDVSLLDTQVACLANIASNYLVAGKEAKRWGTAHESIIPYQVFEASDRPIVCRRIPERTAGIGRSGVFEAFSRSGWKLLRLPFFTAGNPGGKRRSGRTPALQDALAFRSHGHGRTRLLFSYDQKRDFPRVHVEGNCAGHSPRGNELSWCRADG